MVFLITIAVTNIAIVLVILYFLRRFLQNARNRADSSSDTTVRYAQNPAPPTPRAGKEVLDMPAETRSTSAEINPVSQEEIKGMDFLDVYRMPDGPEKTSYLMAFAEAGDGGAQYLLGEAYLFGNGGLDQDFEKSKELLQKSADQGNSNAMTDLTLVCMEMFCDLNNEAEQMPKAMELMDESAYNLAKALTNYNKLALDIYNGNLKMDWNKGDTRKLLLEKTDNAMQPLLEELKAEDKGYSNYILGMLTVRGIGVAQDINQARMYFERGAELGNYESEFELKNPLFALDDDEE